MVAVAHCSVADFSAVAVVVLVARGLTAAVVEVADFDCFVVAVGEQTAAVAVAGESDFCLTVVAAERLHLNFVAVAAVAQDNAVLAH